MGTQKVLQYWLDELSRQLSQYSRLEGVEDQLQHSALEEINLSGVKEIAKFASGAEAFHAFVHGYLLFSDSQMTVFGMTAGPTWNVLGLMFNSTIALALGIYAWRPLRRRSK